ncbi:MAG: sugar phosphate isomerase/epimerase [Candidatus Omnitrophica bacterium]|nr:sugar phosphate isomerase/epimerase [Candidatus Omnitrophota bacterium]
MELSIWSNFYNDLHYGEALRKMKESGFNFSELSDSHFAYIFMKKEFEKLIEIKEKIKINTYQIHAPILSLYEPQEKEIIERLVDLADIRKEIREREVNCIIEYIKWCKVAGVECIVVHPGGIKGYDTWDEFKKIEDLNLESFKKIAEKSEKEKIKIAIENCGLKIGTKKYFPYKTAEELLQLIEKIGSKYIGICLDTSHANVVKANINEFIKTAKEKIYATHISDNLGENDDHLFPFSGKINWKEVIDALDEIKFNGILNFEVPGENRCPLEIRDIKIKYAFKIGSYLIGKTNL